MTEEQKSAVVGVLITVGSNGLGYVTTLYGNNKRGARSEGLGHKGQSTQEAMQAAELAAQRDYPWVDPVHFRFETEPAEGET